MNTLFLTSDTLVGIILGSLITFLLSMVKFRAEARWLKRLDGYDALIRALHHCREFWAYQVKILSGKEPKDEEKFNRLLEQEFKARQFIGFTLEGGLLVMGRKMHRVLQDYCLAVWHARVDTNDPLLAEEARKSSDVCLKKLLDLARWDMFI